MRAIRAVVTSELATLIRGLTDRLHVASVTLLSGSVPKDRSGSESGAEAVRHESQLYDETVLALAGVPLRYGDYGVAHPIPPDKVGMPRRPSPYVHYTLSGRRLYVARKVDWSHGRSEEFAEAFAEVAEELTTHPKFAGQHYSWGDRQFVACRTGGRRTGQAKDWIGWRWRHLITLRTCRAVVTATRAATVDLGLRGDWDAARVHRAEHTSS